MMKDIIIIGAGLSGLTLACLLEKKGFDISIIEASDRIGGRILTVEGKSGTPLELGATWFSDQHHELLSLLKALGLKKYPQFTKGAALFQTQSFEPPQIFSIPETEQPSYRLAGGTHNLIQTLRLKLVQTKIILNSKVIRINANDNKTLTIETENQTFQCKKAIVCLPPQLASSIQFDLALPSELINLLPTVQTWMAGSIKFAIEYSHPFWREKGLSGMLFSHADIVSEMYDHTNFEENKFGFTGFLKSETSSFSQEARKSNVLKQLSGLIGIEALNPTSYFDKVWNDEFIIKGNQLIERPHQNNGHANLQKAYADGMLYFCGTETSTEFSGYMEGAIQSAKRVAGLITE